MGTYQPVEVRHGRNRHWVIEGKLPAGASVFPCGRYDNRLEAQREADRLNALSKFGGYR